MGVCVWVQVQEASSSEVPFIDLVKLSPSIALPGLPDQPGDGEGSSRSMLTLRPSQCHPYGGVCDGLLHTVSLTSYPTHSQRVGQPAHHPGAGHRPCTGRPVGHYLAIQDYQDPDIGSRPVRPRVPQLSTMPPSRSRPPQWGHPRIPSRQSPLIFSIN